METSYISQNHAYMRYYRNLVNFKKSDIIHLDNFRFYNGNNSIIDLRLSVFPTKVRKTFLKWKFDSSDDDDYIQKRSLKPKKRFDTNAETMEFESDFLNGESSKESTDSSLNTEIENLFEPDEVRDSSVNFQDFNSNEFSGDEGDMKGSLSRHSSTDTIRTSGRLKEYGNDNQRKRKSHDLNL